MTSPNPDSTRVPTEESEQPSEKALSKPRRKLDKKIENEKPTLTAEIQRKREGYKSTRAAEFEKKLEDQKATRAVENRELKKRRERLLRISEALGYSKPKKQNSVVKKKGQRP